ncbi:MAG: hypothetical protein FWG55_02050 [Candidatus Bathyarchaeota archaeon]|jgi:hypothetical protein|nr:hypothetical protein [Candidatus Termiticorpusculum sp.]
MSDVCIADMGDLSVDIDTKAFYRFNWRMYVDDGFMMDFYDNPQRLLIESGLKNITSASVNIKKISPLDKTERELAVYLNSIYCDPTKSLQNSMLQPLSAEDTAFYEYQVAIGVESVVAYFVIAAAVGAVLGLVAIFAPEASMEPLHDSFES